MPPFFFDFFFLAFVGLFTRLHIHNGVCLRILLFSWKPIFPTVLVETGPIQCRAMKSLAGSFFLRIFPCCTFHRSNDESPETILSISQPFFLFGGIHRCPFRRISSRPAVVFWNRAVKRLLQCQQFLPRARNENVASSQDSESDQVCSRSYLFQRQNVSTRMVRDAPDQIAISLFGQPLKITASLENSAWILFESGVAN